MTRFALLALAALCACSADAIGTDEDALAADTRADAATAALMVHFWNGSQDYFEGAGYWIYAESFDAVLDAAQRKSTKNFEKWIGALYAAQDKRGWSRDFFDDENWMALTLIRAYDVTHDAKYLSRAESLFADIDQNGRTSSGVWWNRQHTQKATASNFGPAITAARLNERTGKASYEQAAQQIYDYWYSSMVDRTTGQVADHKDGSGIDWTKWTYDTGLAIGASIELWKITGDKAYLNHAHQFGGYLIHEQVASSSYGNVLHDANCTGDCHMFKGIAYRFLAKLWTLDKSQTQYHDVLKASVRAIWYDARSSADTFSPNWTSAATTTTVAADASAVIALNLAAEYGI